jgi:hypothetical protein
MAGAFSAGFPSALPPWHAMHGANNALPSAASEAPPPISSTQPIHGVNQILHEKRRCGVARLFGDHAAVDSAGTMSIGSLDSGASERAAICMLAVASSVESYLTGQRAAIRVRMMLQSGALLAMTEFGIWKGTHNTCN